MKPFAAALALVLAACNSGFDHQYLVTDLRVLAIHVEVQGSGVDPDGAPTATHADGIPGETLELDALVANPTGRGGVTVHWYGCLPRADETLPPCADPAFLADPGRLAAAAAAGDQGVLDLGLGACAPVDSGALDAVCGVTFPIPQLDSALAFILSVAQQEPAYQCRLYADMPVVAVAEAEGRRDVALKRVRITASEADILAAGLEDAYVLNHNPVPREIVRAPTTADGNCSGGTAVTAEPFPTGQTILCADAADDADETFNVCGPAGEISPTSEDLSWQWFTTGGEFPDFDEGIGNTTGPSPAFVRPPGPFTLWAILRDGRGGEVWLRRYVTP